MVISEADRALLVAALERLYSNEVEAFPLATLAAIMGRAGVERIKERRSEYVDANNAAKSAEQFLSPDAQAWWKEAKQTLAYGRLVLSGRGRKAEKVLALKCEELDASFENRVPKREHAFFKIYDIQDEKREREAWDDRWHYCIDGSFPLLRDMANSPLFENTMREAQISIIQEILEAKEYK